MFGRRAIIADWAAERELDDAFETDEERPEWRSYSQLDVDLGIQASPLPIDGYRQSGWLAFA